MTNPERASRVRVAAVQPPSFAGEEENRNAAQACAFIDEAAEAGAQYVVFPEGYPGPYSGPMENDAVERVRERARARRVWVSAGQLERGSLEGTYHIAHLLIDESGEDYLYPATWFVAIELPQAAIKVLQADEEVA